MKEHRSRYSPRVSVQVNWTDEQRKNSPVKQEYGEQMNINAIMRKYNRTGVLPDMMKKEPRYGDFSTAQDYHSALNTIVHAREQFEALPADVRKRFHNDAEAFLQFAEDPENLSEMQEMGLAPKPERKRPEDDTSGKKEAKPEAAPNPPKAENKNPPKPKVSGDK